MKNFPRRSNTHTTARTSPLKKRGPSEGENNSTFSCQTKILISLAAIRETKLSKAKLVCV